MADSESCDDFGFAWHTLGRFLFGRQHHESVTRFYSGTPWCDKAYLEVHHNPLQACQSGSGCSADINKVQLVPMGVRARTAAPTSVLAHDSLPCLEYFHLSNTYFSVFFLI